MGRNCALPAILTLTLILSTSGACSGNGSPKQRGSAAAAALKLTLASPTVNIGQNFAVTVTAVDGGGAAVSAYRGTVSFGADDPMPGPAAVTFTETDKGVRMVAFSLGRVGPHTLTATDTAVVRVTGSVTVQAQEGPRMAILGIGGATTTSTPFGFSVAITRGGQLVMDYRGKIRFSSSDGVAYLPPEYTYTAADGGKHDFKATLNTAGNQMLVATDSDVMALTAAADTSVAGPAYYYVDPTGGKIRLVHNAERSTPAVAILDLVAGTDLNGYFVGMNLRVDASRLNLDGGDVITAGNALDPGSSPPALKADLPAQGPLAGVLVSGLSQKAAGAGAVATDTTIAAAKVFYTLKLAIKAGTPGGIVFDGTVPKTKLRAGLRNRVGTEVVGVDDFAVGKLVYRP
jgi:hypothetical protein